MKNLLATSTLLLILSCNGKEKHNSDNHETIIEQTESGVSSSFKRYEGNSVLLIYSEMMKSDEQLKQLDAKIEQSSEETKKNISEYEKVLDKSDVYYRDANQLTRNFSDSVLKKNIEAVLKGSSDQYNLKTASLKKIITELTKNEKIIQDN